MSQSKGGRPGKSSRKEAGAYSIKATDASPREVGRIAGKAEPPLPAPAPGRPAGRARDRSLVESAPIPATAAVNLPILLHPEPKGGYSVEVPALPGCHTEGDTIENALANAVEAAEGWLLARHDINLGTVRPDARR